MTKHQQCGGSSCQPNSSAYRRNSGLCNIDVMIVLSGDEKATMSDERTPLLAVVPTRPHRDRYPHHTLRYICTLFLSISLFTGLIAAVLILNLVPLDESDTTVGVLRYLPNKLPDGWPNSRGLDYESLVGILQETPDSERAREWSTYYTSGPHLAGKNLSQAIWTKELWQEFGIESVIVDYDVYLNYPKGHRLALLEKNRDDNDPRSASAPESAWKIKYEASLEEDVLDEDASSGLSNRVPTFHGYSASGNVTGSYVFVNYGSYADFEDLLAANISLKGNIALAKYGGVFRGLKVKRAQELGMIGVVMYSDPGDDGDITELNGYATYPDGPARQPSSVQRGSCQFLSKTQLAFDTHFANDSRLCAWRSNHARIPIQAGCTTPRYQPCHSFYSFYSYILPGCTADTESTERTRP